MNDRELLLAAAKAAGLVVVSGSAPVTLYVAMDGCIAGARWNPLTDDGDALRLAVKLRIDVKHYDDYVVCWFDGGYIGTGKVMCGDDPQAATRRAITRAAASTGEAMP